MTEFSTTTLSSKGQIVIPEEVRDALKLEPGDRFFVLCERDVVVLKRIEGPPRSEVRSLAANVRKQARRAGVGRADVGKATRAVRRRK